MDWFTEAYDCASDYDYELPDLIWSIYIEEKWYIVKKEYCTKCMSTDIKISQKWNKYCGKICRKENQNPR